MVAMKIISYIDTLLKNLKFLMKFVFVLMEFSITMYCFSIYYDLSCYDLKKSALRLP